MPVRKKLLRKLMAKQNVRLLKTIKYGLMLIFVVALGVIGNDGYLHPEKRLSFIILMVLCLASMGYVIGHINEALTAYKNVDDVEHETPTITS